MNSPNESPSLERQFLEEKADEWGFRKDTRIALADLPKRLRADLDSDLSLEGQVQLTCINGSNFLDRNNPATKIYNEMRLQDWPQYDDDRLTTMVQLQDYWDRLRRDRDRTYVLVFYENSHAPQPVFSENFLDDMNTFDGAICVVSHQPDIPLQSFSPHEPNLVVNIVEWIKNNV